MKLEEVAWRPGLPVLFLGTDSVQLGVEPELATTFTGLSAAELAAFARLWQRRGRPTRVPSSVARLLHRSRLTISESAPGTANIAAQQLSTARYLRWGTYRGDRQFRSAQIEIYGQLATALDLGRALAKLGIGGLAFPLPNGARRKSVGIDSEFARFNSEMGRQVIAGGVHPDLVIMLADYQLDLPNCRRLFCAGIPVLPVVRRELSVECGPVLQPGLGPCAACVTHIWQTKDDSWCQLDQLPAPGFPPEPGPIVWGWGKQHVAALVDAFFSDNAPRQQAWRLTVGEAAPKPHDYPVNPACWCQAELFGWDGDLLAPQ